MSERLTLKAAAVKLGLSERTLRRRLRAGALPYERDGALVFIQVADLTAYRESCRQRECQRVRL